MQRLWIKLSWLALFSLAVVACGPEASPEESAWGEDSSHADHEQGRAKQPPLAIFLNKEGGSYSWAYEEDPAHNRSLVLFQAYEPCTDCVFSPLDVTASEWDSLLRCVQGAYAPYNIEVTDQEPEQPDYIEVVLTQQSSLTHFEQLLRGIAPSTWSALPRAVAFVFGEHPDLPAAGAQRVEQLCWAAVHEAGHALGLQHSLSCDSPMYPLGSGVCSDEVRFWDRESSCAMVQEPDEGAFEVVPARCFFVDQQNTHRELLSALGPAQTPTSL